MESLSSHEIYEELLNYIKPTTTDQNKLIADLNTPFSFVEGNLNHAQQLNVRMRTNMNILDYAAFFNIDYRESEIRLAFLHAFGATFNYCIQACRFQNAEPTLQQLIQQCTNDSTQRDSGEWKFQSVRAAHRASADATVTTTTTNNIAAAIPPIPPTTTAAAAATATVPALRELEYCFAHGPNLTHSPWKYVLDPRQNKKHRCRRESECPGFNPNATLQVQLGGKSDKWKFNGTLGP